MSIFESIFLGAEMDKLRAELAQQTELHRMERDALTGASKEVERILRDENARLRTALERITGLYLHEAIMQPDEVTVEQMYRVALDALKHTKTA